MGRLTKTEIERRLLAGEPLSWEEAAGSSKQLRLVTAAQRRLFAFLLHSGVREAKGLTEEFLAGLFAAFDDEGGPTIEADAGPSGLENSAPAGPGSTGPWRLQSIEAEGFGGLNTWGGPAFRYDLDQESLLLEGPNGSGKSSLVAAIIWAMAGQRPRDHADESGPKGEPVYNADGKKVGRWSPIACYPPTVAELSSPSRVRVDLTFQSSDGTFAKVARTLDGGIQDVSTDPALVIPPVLLETGLLMPCRMTKLRFRDGSGQLSDAVQKLTGLDDLADIGALVESLCHGGREFLKYSKNKNIDGLRRDFQGHLEAARQALRPVDRDVPEFEPQETDNKSGALAMLGKICRENAEHQAKTIESDLQEGLKLGDAQVQSQIFTAIGGARERVLGGLAALPMWRSLMALSEALDSESAKKVSSALQAAREGMKGARQWHEKQQGDSKLRLKAAGAHWHFNHERGPILDCPLCSQPLTEFPALMEELEALREAGEGATRSLRDNVARLESELKAGLPQALKSISLAGPVLQPREELLAEVRTEFSRDQRFALLHQFTKLVAEGLERAPSTEPLPISKSDEFDDPSDFTAVRKELAEVERKLLLAEWFRAERPSWELWWTELVGPQSDRVPQDLGSRTVEPPTHGAEAVAGQQETLLRHLDRLSEALSAAEPYSRAAAALRSAWTKGQEAAAIEKEQARREGVAAALEPLKCLGALSRAVAGKAILDLSGRISQILGAIYLTDRLEFHAARIDRKDGVSVRGGFDPGLLIDATVVANTSWLRAVLWSFLFALREEAVRQHGSDPFPVLVFDDPQATFDVHHRCLWGQYLASLQSGSSRAQVILATHDEVFLELIKKDGLSGRQALIAAPVPGVDRVSILEGARLEREWAAAKLKATQKAGQEFMKEVREHVECVLRLLLRGQYVVGQSDTLGDLREKVDQLHKAGQPPWNRPVFKKLLADLHKDQRATLYIQQACHAGGRNLGLTEASFVFAHWNERLMPHLEMAFQLVREHRLLHGDQEALHLGPPTAVLPHGYQENVRRIPLQVVGRAAALTDGRAADGMVHWNQYAFEAQRAIVLGDHLAFRLTARTLEPVARPGDLLLVKKHAQPTPKCLVIAISEDRILARRFEIAENHSDVVVLTAQAVNPRQIEQPVVARKATLSLYKVVGVLFEPLATGSVPTPSEMEVSDCGGEAALTQVAARTLGVVEVDGQSAEPHALHGQYLLVDEAVVSEQGIRALDGKPVVAADSNEDTYIKRLRVVSQNQVVLESLDAGGEFGPVVLGLPGHEGNCLERLWPVLGVLFELPN